jgi:hypothetical protein
MIYGGSGELFRLLHWTQGVLEEICVQLLIHGAKADFLAL